MQNGGAGGAKGRRHDEGRGQANNNQTDYVEGGLDGNDDDKTTTMTTAAATTTTTVAVAATTVTMADAVGGVATTG